MYVTTMGCSLTQVVYELPATSQWIFECHWCPRNPSLISTASFDGHVTMYSLLGGGASSQEPVEEKVHVYTVHTYVVLLQCVLSPFIHFMDVIHVYTKFRLCTHTYTSYVGIQNSPCFRQGYTLKGGNSEFSK